MKKHSSLAILLLSVFLGACSQDKSAEPAESSAPKIAVYQLQAEDVPIYQEFVGQIHGFKDISILARVEGFLEGIHFQEGQHVKKGDLLYTIEGQQYEAGVAAALGELAKARTLYANAKSQLNRIRPLAKTQAVSQSTLDAAVSNFKASKGTVDAALANLKAAKIQLSYARIVSPISGVIGKTKAKIGDFVGRSPSPVVLNGVSNIDKALVEFHLPESKYLKFYRYINANKAAFDDNKAGPYLELILADGTVLADKGHVTFLDREVDSTTGSILVQAVFANQTGILRPGLFGKVRAEVTVAKGAVLVPQRSVMSIQGRRSVFVVNHENKVELRDIKTGPTIASFWLVVEGLKAGETVVYEGLQKVRAGMLIEPQITKLDSPVKGQR